MGPGGGPPAHVQHREDECFYVLEGRFEFVIECSKVEAATGSLIYVPKGDLHTFENVGETAGRMLVSQTPGGVYEGFVEEVGKPVEGNGGPPDIENRSEVGRIIEVAVEYGIEIPSPFAEENV